MSTQGRFFVQNDATIVRNMGGTKYRFFNFGPDDILVDNQSSHAAPANPSPVVRGGVAWPTIRAGQSADVGCDNELYVHVNPGGVASGAYELLG
jgi:hypothetical protein